MNDQEREEWINSDEGMYQWFRSARCGITTFVRKNRAEIDAAIRKYQDEHKPR